MTHRRVFVESISGNLATVEGPRAHHLHRVARLRRGELVELSNSQRLFLASVKHSSGERVEFEVRQELTVPQPAVPIALGLAIFKFSRLEWAIEKATELGAGVIVPLATARCDKRLIEAAHQRRERWQKIAEEAAAQSRRLAPPAVEGPTPFEQLLPMQDAGLGLFLDTGSPPFKDVLTAALLDNTRPPAATLLIGPEGGWTDAEREAAQQAGYLPAGLGPGILRAETAAVAALSVFTHWLSR